MAIIDQEYNNLKATILLDLREAHAASKDAAVRSC